jgi:hypothetical protein
VISNNGFDPSRLVGGAALVLLTMLARLHQREREGKSQSETADEICCLKENNAGIIWITDQGVGRLKGAIAGL